MRVQSTTYTLTLMFMSFTLACDDASLETKPTPTADMSPSQDMAQVQEDMGRVTPKDQAQDLPPDTDADAGVEPCTPATLSPHADERAQAGTTYTVAPAGQLAGVKRWRKLIGPDDVRVDAQTGELSWTLPAQLPGESFYVGVRGVDACGGVVEDTWIVTVGDGEILRVGQAHPHQSIRAAIAAAKSGDTIIVDPGLYEGEAHSLDSQGTPVATPPSGSATAFTTLMAAEPGQTTVGSMLRVAGKWGEQHHMAFKGLLLKGGVSIERSGDDASPRPHHIKLVYVGGEATIGLSRADDILIESCYSYGDGRYRFSAYKSERVIFRRTVARMDHAALRGDVSPFGGYIAYSSRDIVFQNVIDVDSDQHEAYPVGEPTGAFGVPVTAGDSLGIRFERAIALNNVNKFGSYDARGDGNGGLEAYSEVEFQDVIGWNITTKSGLPDVVHGFGQGIFRHATFGVLRPGSDLSAVRALFNGYGGAGILRDGYHDTLFTDVQGAMFSDVEDSSYNAFHQIEGLGSAGPGHQPETYLMLTEQPLENILHPKLGSPVSGAASDGGDIGATVLNLIGASGSFYGEAGWDQEVGQSMWPFPYEDVIKAHMGAYRFDGTLQDGRAVVMSGARGFAAPGQALDGGPVTLTSYIWEYLGQPCPAERCGR